MSNKENEIQDRVILVDGEPPSNPQAGVFFAFVNKLLKTKDSGGNIDTYAKIEQGSNTDGEWIKLYLTEYTGILVCYGLKAVTSGTTYPFPMAFSSSPYFIPNTRRVSGDTGHTAMIGASHPTTTDYNVIIRDFSGTQLNRDVFWIAIGTFDDTPA